MKNYGRYTATAAKVLKESDRLICNVAPDGTIILVNGHILFTMNQAEYVAIAQPVTLCDAGNWEITNTGRRETTTNFVKFWADSVEAVTGSGVLEFAPLFRVCDKSEVVGAWDADKEAVYLYNRRYIGSIDAAAAFRTKGDLAPAVAFSGPDPFAMVLPIDAKRSVGGLNMVRAVRAWFAEESAEERPASEPLSRRNLELQELAEKLQAERDSLAAELAEAQRERDCAKSKIYDLENALSAEAATVAALAAKVEAAATMEPAEERPAAISKADAAAALFADLPGVTVTVKGAQTAAPVLWFSGNTEPHADSLRAKGAKWSVKKSAFYYCA